MPRTDLIHLGLSCKASVMGPLCAVHTLWSVKLESIVPIGSGAAFSLTLLVL